MKKRVIEQQISSCDSVSYGGFLSRLDYEKELKKRDRKSSSIIKTIFTAFFIFVYIGILSFMSFFDLNSRFDNIMNENEENNALTSSELPGKNESTFPYALICMSRLGIYGSVISSSEAEIYDMPYGIKISVITKESAKNGFNIGDIVLSVNDERISNYDEMITALSQYNRGMAVKISLFREGEYIFKTIVLK